jgi:hypothetical protein
MLDVNGDLSSNSTGLVPGRTVMIGDRQVAASTINQS